MKFLMLLPVIFFTTLANAETIFDCSGEYLASPAVEAARKITFTLESTANDNLFAPPIDGGTKIVLDEGGLRIVAGNLSKRVSLTAEIRSQENKKIYIRSSSKSDSTEVLSLEYNQVSEKVENRAEIHLSVTCIKR